jgi:probable HAF family extracellular repeat protein
MIMRRAAAGTAIVALGAGSGAWAQCQYDLASVHGPDCDPLPTSPTRGSGINEAGQVVGYYTVCAIGTGEAFLWDGGPDLITLERPAGVGGAGAHDINDAGLIAGTMILDGIGDRAFVHDGTGFIDLGVPAGGLLSFGGAINNQGDVVGTWGIGLQAFLYRDGVMIDLSADLGTPASRATDINDAGQVVGWMGMSYIQDGEGFIWHDGEVTALGHLPDGSFTEGLCINELGQVAGYALIGEFPNYTSGRAILWDEGELIDLGNLPGYERTAATGINDAGQIVGRAWFFAGNPNIESAFIWQKGVMYDLNDLMVPGTGFETVWATAINNQGQITGTGHNADGDVVAVLLAPLDVPVGDIDVDCTVGFDDFLVLLDAWGPCPPAGACPADLDGDGQVSILDFLILLANWG